MPHKCFRVFVVTNQNHFDCNWSTVSPAVSLAGSVWLTISVSPHCVLLVKLNPISLDCGVKVVSQTFNYAALFFRLQRQASQSWCSSKVIPLSHAWDASLVSAVSTLEFWVWGRENWAQTCTPSFSPKKTKQNPICTGLKQQWQCWDPEKDAISKANILKKMGKIWSRWDIC